MSSSAIGIRKLVSFSYSYDKHRERNKEEFNPRIIKFSSLVNENQNSVHPIFVTSITVLIYNTLVSKYQCISHNDSPMIVRES